MRTASPLGRGANFMLESFGLYSSDASHQGKSQEPVDVQPFFDSNVINKCLPYLILRFKMKNSGNDMLNYCLALFDQN